QQCQIFYHGLDCTGQQLVDTYAGGDIGTKGAREAFEILEKVAMKNHTQQSSRGKGTRHGVHQVDDVIAITARMDALSSKFDMLLAGQVQSQPGGDMRDGVFQNSDCSSGDVSHEQVDFMGNQYRPQNNPYSNTYNPGWKNHPNFS
ncbi:MAG: hypothetical protein Q8755_02625, partial [Candidatus Phytoplasma australasiaticum]|nr:hypothetical protein [Candidatus Phytoplasma australasiaticum]